MFWSTVAVAVWAFVTWFAITWALLSAKSANQRVTEVDEALTNELRGLQTYCENNYARRRLSRKRNGRDAIPPPPAVVSGKDLDYYFGRSEATTEPAGAPESGSD